MDNEKYAPPSVTFPLDSYNTMTLGMISSIMLKNGQKQC